MVDGTMVGDYIYTMNNLSFDFNKPVSNYKFTSNQKEAFINCFNSTACTRIGSNMIRLVFILLQGVPIKQDC